MPAFVPTTLASSSLPAGPSNELAKPILFDCDYEYKPDEDQRLTVKWFKNKEAEPFYQWLPELNVRHFADWIRPLVNQTFVTDQLDPLKRYRSLLVRRLSMNLTGQYTCLVSSLAGQDMRQASLVVYQPPRTFTFEHRIYPAPPAGLLAGPQVAGDFGVRSSAGPSSFSPTQFRGLAGQPSLVRPANNNDHLQVVGSTTTAATTTTTAQTSTKIVYTHDGRPIRRKTRRQVAAGQFNASMAPISAWQLKKRLTGPAMADQQQQQPQHTSHAINSIDGPPQPPSHVIQLHHFQCQASQVSPRPVLVLTVKRGADSIAQYLHESSLVSVRPYQAASPLDTPAGVDIPASLVTLYDITVSATVALNVSLPGGEPRPTAAGQAQLAGLQTVLGFRRGQRMSFECHLELTGTDFEQRKRININEEGKSS